MFKPESHEMEQNQKKKNKQTYERPNFIFVTESYCDMVFENVYIYGLHPARMV